jgi:hypothetical protein
MKKTISILTMSICTLTSFGQWTTLITDASGDATPGGLDGTVLEYQYDEPNDEVLFRIKFTNLAMHASTPSADFSFALPNGLDSGSPTGTHWTSSTPVHKTAASYTDPGGLAPSSYTYSSMGTWQDQIAETSSSNVLCGSGCVGIYTDVASNQITYTFDRNAIITDTEMGGNSAVIGLVMNVGNNIGWADGVTHAQNGASNVSFTITKTVTSLSDEVANSILVFYPNPSSNVLHFDNEKVNSAIIYDVTGKELVKFNNDNMSRVDVSSLANGLYFISLFDDSNQLIVSDRFLKQ